MFHTRIITCLNVLVVLCRDSWELVKEPLLLQCQLQKSLVASAAAPVSVGSSPGPLLENYCNIVYYTNVRYLFFMIFFL